MVLVNNQLFANSSSSKTIYSSLCIWPFTFSCLWNSLAVPNFLFLLFEELWTSVCFFLRAILSSSVYSLFEKSYFHVILILLFLCKFDLLKKTIVREGPWFLKLGIEEVVVNFANSEVTYKPENNEVLKSVVPRISCCCLNRYPSSRSHCLTVPLHRKCLCSFYYSNLKYLNFLLSSV